MNLRVWEERRRLSLAVLEEGQISQWAQENRAAMFVLEHRFYGQSKHTENLKLLSC